MKRQLDADERAAIADETRQAVNAARQAQRRQLYRTDPLFRLSLLKANRERRLRAKLQLAADRRRMAVELTLAKVERRHFRKAVLAKAGGVNFTKAQKVPPSSISSLRG